MADGMTGDGVTVLIPMLDEAAALPRLVDALRKLDPPPAEILCVDGGSTDESVALANAAGWRVIACDRGRSVQINHGVEQASAWNLSPATARSWEAGHKAMLRNTTALLGEGVLLGKDPWEVGDYVNGALHEGCDAENATILTLQNLTRRAAALGKRLIYQCHGKGQLDEMAAFLIGVGEHQYYGCGGWNGGPDFSSHRPAEFDRPLGAPKAAGAYNATTGEWTREFASGTEVVFNARSKKGRITWGV